MSKEVTRMGHIMFAYLLEEKEIEYTLLMSWSIKFGRENMDCDWMPTVKSKHYCEIQRFYHLNMRVDASDKDRAS